MHPAELLELIAHTNGRTESDRRRLQIKFVSHNVQCQLPFGIIDIDISRDQLGDISPVPLGENFQVRSPQVEADKFECAHVLPLLSNKEAS